MTEGEEKEQEIGNLFEKIMKENFPNLVKEIDMQVHVSSVCRLLTLPAEFPSAESPNYDGSKEAHSKTHHY